MRKKKTNAEMRRGGGDKALRGIRGEGEREMEVERRREVQSGGEEA